MKLSHRFAQPARRFATAALSLHSTPNPKRQSLSLGQQHQPIYWPGQRNCGTAHQEKAEDPIQPRETRFQAPTLEKFREIFGVDDRPAAPQVHPRASTNKTPNDSHAGTQRNYGGLFFASGSGDASACLDYYVSASEAHKTIYRSPIQHPWIGTGSGGSSSSGGDGSGLVTVFPSSPVAGNLTTT